MKRREFISLIRAGTRAWPLAARAQQPDPVQRIGVLMHLAADDPEGKSRLAAFLQGPREAGWAVAFFVMFLFGLVVLTGLPAHASEKLWRDALSASRCFADPPEQESVLLIASAWEGKSLPQLFKDAGWKDVQKSLANDGDFSSVFQERKKQLVGQVLSSTQQGLDRFKRDVATKNPITCLIASFQAAENLQIVAQDQANAGAARQPYLKVAQYVLKLQGCRIETGEGGTPSGLFGKASRESWRIAVAKLKIGSFENSDFPTPAEVGAMATATVDPHLCDEGGVAANPPSVLPFVRLFANQNGDCAAAPLSADKAAVTRAVLADARLARGLPGIFCGGLVDEIVSKTLANAKQNSAAMAKFVQTFLGAYDLAKPNGDTFETSVAPDWQSATLVPTTFIIPLYQLPSVVRFTGIVANSEPAQTEVLHTANNNGLTALGVILTEGLADSGKDAALGLRFFMAAADEGSDFAMLRAGQAYEQGYGVPADIPHAMTYYRRLADRGRPAGFLALARLNEDGTSVPADLAQAAKWYEGLFGSAVKTASGGDAYFQGIADAIQGRLIAGAGYLSSKAGLELLDYWANSIPALARALGDVFSCVECGGTINAEVAVKWYRKAISGFDADSQDRDEIAYKLARLLVAMPKLATSPDEAHTILVDAAEHGGTKSGLLLFYLDAAKDRPSEGELLTRIKTKMTDKACGGGDSASSGDQKFSFDCTQFAHQMAIGAFDERLVAYGYQFLSSASAHALEKKDDDQIPVLAFIDVLAYYGDFRSARALLARSPALDLDHDAFTARNSVIARLLAQQAPTQTARIVELKSFLDLAAQRRDESANTFLDALQQGSRPITEVADPASANSVKAALAERIARGGVSEGLVSVARQSSQIEFSNGNSERAIELELASLNAEIELENVASIFNGPLPTALASVCHYAKASHRISGFGNSNLALLLAKTAVNELQAVRKSVRQLPQQLQLCFAELVSNHYRWLADLFIQQNRIAEAEKVLGFLKNFETFEFLDRDDRFQGNAFESLPLSSQEVETQRAISGIVLPSARLGQRERELELKQKTLAQSNRSLSSAEQSELTSIKEQLRAQSEKTAALLAQIEKALKVSGDTGEAARLQLGSVQARLRNEYKAKAVAIHYVILPDRMHIILTMPVGAQLAYSWESLDGAPFTEDALNKKIVDFRNILQKPSKDVIPAAQALYKILIAPFEKEIGAVNPTTILVSADKKLRLVPFAALHNGSDYLAKSIGVVMMTAAPSPVRHMPADASISAFGTTKAFPGFSELPNVKAELDGLVRVKQGSGLFPGQEFIDQQFTRRALASGLLFGTATIPKLGMVHIASHFKLGAGEADSFLLLGNGDRLSIKDIRTNMGANREFDFGDVDLLTLSACETAYALPDTDGLALESFATATQEVGVRSVVGTLWPIADQATPIFMRQFYALSAKQGVSRDVALAQAQTSLLESAQTAKAAGNLLLDYSHPYYWAPFILLQGMQ